MDDTEMRKLVDECKRLQTEVGKLFDENRQLKVYSRFFNAFITETQNSQTDNESLFQFMNMALTRAS